MASPAPTGAVPAPTPSSGPRWARSGEPGSAFNGLTRPARGGGGGGRGRGGPSSRGARGSGRGAPSARDAKPQDSPKPTAPSPLKTHTPDKPATSSTQTKPKPPSSRRNSRTIPPAVVTQLSTADIPPSPLSARSPSSRRRRSQAGKTTASIPSRINPPAPNDNLLRPHKPILPTVPHTAPVKDTPPHLLAQKPYIRNDIDALVERVRASAMDHNRPSTPGTSSHIDWAGDDDDSLPDLDDWGVNPATFSASKSEIISPIIVDGLKHLPDIAPHSYQSSPLREHREVSPEATEESHVHDTNSASTHPSSPSVKEQVVEVKEVVESKPSIHSVSLLGSSWRPLHPSLPAKPVTSAPVAPLKSSVGATPMRIASFPKSPNDATTPSKSSKFPSAMEQTPVPESLQAETTTTEETSEVVITDQPISEVGVVDGVEEPLTVEVVAVEAAPEGVPEPVQNHKAKDPMDSFQVVEGLSASIHAPKAGSDSASAPPHISTYAESNTSLLRGAPLTHTRAHTVGRPPSFPRPHQPDHPPRSSRSGHGPQRGGFQQNNTHSRTHSNPSPGAAHRSHNGSRPVLSGAALSRLAKTIGGNNASPGKTTVATLGD